jgi:hypothetical protein
LEADDVLDGWICTPLTKTAEQPKSGADGVASLVGGLLRLKSLSVGGAAGAALLAWWLWQQPQHPFDVAFSLLLAVGAIAGMAVQGLLSWLAGWFVNPLLRHLEAAWEARLEQWRLSVAARRGAITETEARRIASRIARRDVKGESGPYEPPRQRNRFPKSSQPGAGGRAERS